MSLSAPRDAASWREPVIWLAAFLSLAAVIAASGELLKAKNANETIRDLMGRKDVAVDSATAPAEVVLARINELMRRDRLDEAQTLLSSASPRLPPLVRAHALYNIANERTRQSAEFVHKGDLDRAAALINIAKSEYRLALKIDPQNWDFKHNLDVAMRIVRDLPQAENLPDASPEAPKRLWTDLPGVPRGLP